jgi:hypothetical protein
MISDDDYKAYVDRLASDEKLKIHLSKTPTTMGPGYIAEKITEILDAKSIVNEMSEKVEMALCESEVWLNDLEEEVQLRTHVEYQNFDPDATGMRNAKSRDSYIWTQVEQGYVSDHQAEFALRSTPTNQFQLSEDLKTARSDIIRFKALLRIIDHRRDELGKLDSGVRLQQKTMETEAAIYGKGGIPQPQAANNGNQGNIRGHVDVGVVPREVDESDDPDALEEDFDAPPPPIDEEVPY